MAGMRGRSARCGCSADEAEGFVRTKVVRPRSPLVSAFFAILVTIIALRCPPRA